ncbi:lysozyme C-like [Pelodytes ibericus]
MRTLFLFLLLASGAKGWIIDKCALAEELKKGGVVGYKKYTVEDFLCLTHYSSDYDTSLNQSPSEYGLFQINSYWWCNDGVTRGRKNLCGILCKDLLDKDVKDDIRCLKRILRDPNGLNAWTTWTLYCKGNDLSHFSSDC